MQTPLATLRDNKTPTTVVLALPDKNTRVGLIIEVTSTCVALEAANGTVHHINPAHIVEFYETPDAVAGRVYSAANRTNPRRIR